MIREEAKSELMQIYMSLSEEKKQALDVLMAQADGEYILKKDVMCCIGQTSLHWELARKLRKLPSVAIPSAEPKTGHWIAQDIYNCHTEFKCSECGYIHSFMHLYGKPTADYTYCPNCGAKMD